MDDEYKIPEEEHQFLTLSAKEHHGGGDPAEEGSVASRVAVTLHGQEKARAMYVCISAPM